MRQVTESGRAGQPFAALRVAKLACLRYPSSIPARLAHADACLDMGMVSEALMLWEALLDGKPAGACTGQRACALEGSAAALFSLGDIVAADARAQEALAWGSTTRTQLPRAQLVSCQIGTSEACVQAWESIAHMPVANPLTDLTKALVSVTFGTVEDTWKHLQAANEKGLKASGMRFEQALVLRREGRFKDALALLNDAMKQAPCLQLRGLRAVVLLELEYHDAALLAFAELLDLGEENPLIWQGYAKARRGLAANAPPAERTTHQICAETYEKKAAGHPLIACKAGVPFIEDLVRSLLSGGLFDRAYSQLKAVANAGRGDRR